jgi:hypothetical protein
MSRRSKYANLTLVAAIVAAAVGWIATIRDTPRNSVRPAGGKAVRKPIHHNELISG